MIAWFAKLGNLNLTGQRYFRMLTAPTRNLSVPGPNQVLMGFKGGKDTVQSVASSVLTTLAMPLAWTDEALGRRVKLLGWSRDRLTDLATT